MQTGRFLASYPSIISESNERSASKSKGDLWYTPNQAHSVQAMCTYKIFKEKKLRAVIYGFLLFCIYKTFMASLFHWNTVFGAT